ncbi:glycosyltransferase family 4 protein [Lutimonas saemankumensis]|uniref:glycosyltransferase family 4 protein n=1 Tax=Lutimonas saemankumensis TaxID=483016 RepID=UPI001CD60F4E|nr:glycosyltransferase family 1 protein [Lutimonas saemankumensis]MCA0931597.1 glycosyltransferase family 4 protein [Lutimonas saemankumensis]
MEVWIDATYLEKNVSGMSRVNYEILKQFNNDKSLDIKLISFKGKLLDKYSEFKGIEIVKLRISKSHFIWLNCFFPRITSRVFKRLFSIPDYILWMTFDHNLIQLSGTKQISYVHDLAALKVPHVYPKRRNYQMSKSLKLLAKSNSQVVAISDHTKSDLVNLFQISKNRVSVAYNGVSASFFDTNYDKTRVQNLLRHNNLKKEQYFIFAGIVGPRKNIEVIIKAVNNYNESRENKVPLVIVGSSKQRVLNNIVDKENLSNLVFPGWVQDDELKILLGNARAFLFPSLYEGFGLPILEAMACMTAVIVSNNSCLPEIAGGRAILCDPNIPEDWTNAMYQLDNLTNDEIQVIKEKGKLWAEKFQWKNSYSVIRQIIKN